jgi:hypothetical protein
VSLSYFLFLLLLIFLAISPLSQAALRRAAAKATLGQMVPVAGPSSQPSTAQPSNTQEDDDDDLDIDDLDSDVSFELLASNIGQFLGRKRVADPTWVTTFPPSLPLSSI